MLADLGLCGITNAAETTSPHPKMFDQGTALENFVFDSAAHYATATATATEPSPFEISKEAYHRDGVIAVGLRLDGGP